MQFLHESVMHQVEGLETDELLEQHLQTADHSCTAVAVNT